MSVDDVVYGTDTRIVWLSGKQPAIPISPLLATHGTPGLATQSVEQLLNSPADWIFVVDHTDFTESTPQLRGLLESDYRLIAETSLGQWWTPVR